MTFTTSSISSQSVNFSAPVPAALTAFKSLSTDEQLGVLWFIYKAMGNGSVTPAATGAARMQFAAGLLDQVTALTPGEQMAFMQDLIGRRKTPMTSAYGVLTNNTKLAFWYQLAELMQAGRVIGVPINYTLSSRAQSVYDRIVALEFGQQITLLRQIVVNMGYDSFA